MEFFSWSVLPVCVAARMMRSTYDDGNRELHERRTLQGASYDAPSVSDVQRCVA
jgi:hypothetical protein